MAAFARCCRICVCLKSTPRKWPAPQRARPPGKPKTASRRPHPHPLTREPQPLTSRQPAVNQSRPGLKAARRAALVVALCLPATLVAAETVWTYTGSESRNTPEFKVRGPWLLDWRISTDGSPQTAIDVALHQAGTGVYEGRVLTTKFPGNGVKLFEEGGEFYFRVDSSFATWTFKVQQLSKQEAEQYSPRSDG